MSGCTECSRTQPNGISFPAPRTVRCTIDRPSTPVYFTRLSLFIASGRSGLLSDCAVGAAVDFRFPLVFSATSGRRAWDGGIRPAPRIACCCPSLLLLITICPVYRLFTVYVGPPVLIEGLSGERCGLLHMCEGTRTLGLSSEADRIIAHVLACWVRCSVVRLHSHNTKPTDHSESFCVDA